MQDQKSLMLHWRSFLGGGSDIVTSIFANKGSQCWDYGLTVLHSPSIIENAWQKSLTLCWRSFLGGSSDILISILHSMAANTSIEG